MTTTSEYAVFAIDAGNRGYNEGVYGPDGPLSTSNNTPIGGGTLVGTSRDLGLDPNTTQPRDIQAGFFATTYRVGTEVIISFRGADGLFSDDFFDVVSAVTSWSQPSEQLMMAIEYYKLVLSEEVGTGDTVTLVGHSLGGFLAGAVASLFEEPAVVFDAVGFHQTVNNIHAAAQIDAQLSFDIWGTLVPPTSVGYASISGWDLAGDPAQLIRGGASDRPDLDIGPTSGLSLDDLHSRGLITIRSFLEEQTSTQWEAATPRIAEALYNQTLAESLGIVGHNGTPADHAMSEMIAFTIFGDSPFGNVAIHSLVANMEAMAPLISAGFAYDAWLADTVVSFAGLQAKHVVEGTPATTIVAFDPLDGSVTIDVTDATWSFGQDSDVVMTRVSELFDQLVVESGATGLSALLASQTIDIEALFFTVAPIVSVGTALPNGAWQMVVGTGVAEEITGSEGNDIIFAGSGGDGDVINASGGNNIIVGSDANDVCYAYTEEGQHGFNIIIAGVGDDEMSSAEVMLGGEGNDYFWGIYEGGAASGGAGNDTFEGADYGYSLYGSDPCFLWGGEGQDSFYFNTFSTVSLVDDVGISDFEMATKPLADAVGVDFVGADSIVINAESDDELYLSSVKLSGAEYGVIHTKFEYDQEMHINVQHDFYGYYDGNYYYYLGLNENDTTTLYVSSDMVSGNIYMPEDLQYVFYGFAGAELKVHGFTNGDFGIWLTGDGPGEVTSEPGYEWDGWTGTLLPVGETPTTDFSFVA